MAEIAELIERMERASGPDRELDYEIDEHLNGHWLRQHGYRREGAGWWSDTPPVKGGNSVAPPQEYTSSIDAALSLVPEGMAWCIDWASDIKSATVWGGTFGFGVEVGHAPTPALALCIAALRARSHSMGE